jgi:ubiquitin-protein ligase
MLCMVVSFLFSVLVLAGVIMYALGLSVCRPQQSPHINFITYGIDNERLRMEDYENQLSEWNAMIIGPQNTNLGERMYSCEIICGPHYPERPPTIKIKAPQINMPCVNQQTGDINVNQVINWNRTNCIIDALINIRQQMQNAAHLQQVRLSLRSASPPCCVCDPSPPCVCALRSSFYVCACLYRSHAAFFPVPKPSPNSSY